MKKIANYLLIDKQEEIYTISMTAELQDDIGTVGYVELAQVEQVAADDLLLNLEASKTVMGIHSPLAGRVLAFNQALEVTPSLLNSEKAEENWIVKLTDVSLVDFAALEDA
ncbi:glycine cleavage system protein H [Streptococcus cuniculipharyngis]|uniref:Glycine cleavage system protein H n=1 Tax=Streptococcus cuniculipharyngis TaxID=1562651 RepID=A0A5C5SFA8_9STRE|nr:glycine cleavage system protein H [Streptococcus cuniculipharyngis]TWS98823.1 glycine cleavage system protein H [Streptococcus cuniculipharyngis]